MIPCPAKLRTRSSEVEVRGRLVHHQDARLLGKRAGDQGELPLAAGNARVDLLGQRGDAHGRDRLARDGAVARRGGGEQPDMRGASHQHHVGDEEGKVAGMGLRHVCCRARSGGQAWAGRRNASG